MPRAMPVVPRAVQVVPRAVLVTLATAMLMRRTMLVVLRMAQAMMPRAMPVIRLTVLVMLVMVRVMMDAALVMARMVVTGMLFAGGLTVFRMMRRALHTSPCTLLNSWRGNGFAGAKNSPQIATPELALEGSVDSGDSGNSAVSVGDFSKDVNGNNAEMWARNSAGEQTLIAVFREGRWIPIS